MQWVSEDGWEEIISPHNRELVSAADWRNRALNQIAAATQRRIF